MSDQGTLIHYGELALKKHNRGKFIKQLANNIELKTGGRVSIYEGRLYLEGGNPDKLKNIFGISWYSPSAKVERTIESIRGYIFKVLDDIDTEDKTFGVFIKRSDKRFKPDSMGLARILGQDIVDRYSMSVDLKNPDISVRIGISQKAFIHFTKRKGPGGLPVGVTGNVLALLSGGIDSPVASYLMMKRGCNVDFIHFHTFPENKRVINTKIIDIVRKLGDYQNTTNLYLVPYKIFEKEILKSNVPNGYEMILFRSFMFRLSEAIVMENGYKAIVTGDSLSQVASQTIENIAAASNNCETQVFRPLISFDKEDIIRIASDIDTYDLSITGYKECCSILSRNPVTRSKLKVVDDMIKSIGMDDIVEKSKELVDSYQFPF